VALSLLPFVARHNPRVEELAWIYRLILLCADVLSSPPWVCLRWARWPDVDAVRPARAVRLRRDPAVAGPRRGFASSIGLVGSGVDSHSLDSRNLAP